MCRVEFKIADEYDVFIGVQAVTDNQKPYSEIYVNSILVTLIERYYTKIYDSGMLREALIKFGKKVIDEHFDEFINYLVEVIEHETIHCVLNKFGVHNVVTQEFVAFVVEGVRNPKILFELDKAFAMHGDYQDLDNEEIISKIERAVAKLLGFKSVDELYRVIE